MSALQQWTPTTLGELLIFTGGSQPPLSVFSKIEHEGYIRLIQIRDYKTDKYTTYIPKDLARRFCDADDIMIGRYGPPIFQILRGLEGAYNVALIKVTPKGNILKDFAWHYLRNDRLFKHIDKLSRRTSGQTGVDLNELENYPIQLPPLAEQQKIAQALTDADDYISALEKLIEKKKMIKEGLMVNLLTGKQRLKEFAFNEDGTEKGYKDSELGKIPEDWDVTILDQAMKLINGRAYALHEWEQSGIPVIRLQNLTGSGEDYYYSNLKLPEKNYCYKGDVLFMWSASFGPYIWKGEKAIFHYHIWKVEPFNHINRYFVFHSLNFITQELKCSASNGGTMLHITKTFMDKLPIIMPPFKEQLAISKGLTDADEDIEALSNKLKKARSIKEGMMQKLLTGEIRLA
ncbi:restriction endonuclease subunit S [uncultured Acinetobacter sp.]|uniref:restriction endonuclease subunit S n=1 Tax=uncultured Acinetobacter sp. TaxID=165433 RepID=UPI002582E9BC|nr:restriction endonuclease subunit S [uncultured Acinetobacter sp.]